MAGELCTEIVLFYFILFYFILFFFLLSYHLFYFIYLLFYISPRYAGEVLGGDTRHIVFYTCSCLSMKFSKLHAQKFEQQSYFTGYYVTYCLRSPQLARGTEQTAQCQFTRPISRAAIGSYYASSGIYYW